ncbi:hypothetical protein ACCO45_009805 [Purpureocillium lilacinum]|uniref:Uncharacterized protein n=1 Tax=Purpureocillium lilacinum TaxID=33203 RepID=A0ACC4DKW4_PURLI
MTPFRALITLAFAATAWALPQTGNEARTLTCLKWCPDNFPNLGLACIAQAALGKGPCYECGPKSTSTKKKLCNRKCIDTSADKNNCGACGKTCSTSCVNGVCSCRAIRESCQSSTAGSCCTGQCSTSTLGGSTGFCCQPSNQPCDINDPGECCSQCCKRVGNLEEFVCCLAASGCHDAFIHPTNMVYTVVQVIDIYTAYQATT